MGASILTNQDYYVARLAVEIKTKLDIEGLTLFLAPNDNVLNKVPIFNPFRNETQ